MAIVNKYIDSCGLLGILRRPGSDPIPGEVAIEAMEPAKPRGAGLGAGFATFNVKEGPLNIGVFAREDRFNDVVNTVEESLIDEGFSIVGRNIRARHKGIVDVEYTVDGDGRLTEVAHEVNRALWMDGRAGRIYYWGRHIRVFKGVGQPDDIAKLYGLSKVEADLWIAHTRFPTNSPGYLPYWSHPFSLGDLAVAHNGELSSYGIHALHMSLTLGVSGLVGTDSEAVAYLLHYMINVYGLSIEDAVKILVNPPTKSINDPYLAELLRRFRWARLDGPFTIVVGLWHNNDLYMVAVADRFKLRPVVVGYDEDNYYVASEEAQIRAVSPNARVWTLKPGGYFIVSAKRGIIAWGRPLEEVEVFFPRRSFPRYIGPNVIDAGGLGYREVNEQILRMVKEGHRVVRVVNVNGQRFIGVNLPRHGVRGVRIEIYGTPGNSLANLNEGVEFVVYGNAQDDVADTMHGGKVVIHGDARDVLGQTLQGGYIFVRGSAGNRVGIQMREYVDKRPYMVIGGRVDDYLGEYMAGGVIMVLGIDALGKPLELTGRYVGSGMVGGRIYIRGRVDESKIGLAPSDVEVKALKEAIEEGREYVKALEKAYKLMRFNKPNVEYRELTEDEVKELKPVLTEYAGYFNLGQGFVDDYLGLKYTVVTRGASITDILLDESISLE